MGHKGHYGEYSGNAKHSKHHMVNSWEEEDVKRGKKQMAEGHTGHAEALFDDAHGSYNYDGHNSTGAEHGPHRDSSPINNHVSGHVTNKHGSHNASHRAHNTDRLIMRGMEREQDIINSRPSTVGSGMTTMPNLQNVGGLINQVQGLNDLRNNVRGYMSLDDNIYPNGEETYFNEAGGIKQKYVDNPNLVMEEEDNRPMSDFEPPKPGIPRNSGSPMFRHTRPHKLRQKAIKISEESGAERGDSYDYENPQVVALLEKANKLDKRTGKKSKKTS